MAGPSDGRKGNGILPLHLKKRNAAWAGPSLPFPPASHPISMEALFSTLFFRHGKIAIFRLFL